MHQCPLFAVMGLHSYQLGPESGLGENTVSGGGGLSEMTSFMGSEARGRRRRLSSTQGRPCNAIHHRPGPHVSVVRFVDHTQKRLLVFRLFCTTCSEFLIAAFSSIALHYIPTMPTIHATNFPSCSLIPRVVVAQQLKIMSTRSEVVKSQAEALEASVE